MSRRNAFFTPQSLQRVAQAVDWEPELVLYPDGSSNQGRFMEALAILYGRWLREASIPDFLAMAQAAAAKDFAKGFSHVMQELPEKVAQVVGFYKGILRRKTVARTTGSVSTGGEASPGGAQLSSIESEVFLVCEEVILQLRKILRE